MEAPEDFIKAMGIIHSALATGAAMFTAVTAYVRWNQLQFRLGGSSMPMVMAGLLLGALAIAASITLFSMRLKKVWQLSNIDAKLELYRQAYLAKLSYTEAGIILNVILTLTTGSGITLAAAVVLLIFLLLQVPGKAKVLSELQITSGR